MRSVFMAGIVTLVMVGCATPQEMMAKPPLVSVQTKLSVEQAASHILSRWSAHVAVPSQTRIGDSIRITIMNNMTGGPVCIADVSPRAEGGSIATYRELRIAGIPHPGWRKEALTSLP